LSRKKIAIIGSGVVGLGAALKGLLDGNDVVIHSDPTYFMPTSPVSAAFWFPYACSMTLDMEIKLARPTYTFLRSNMQDPNAGISLRKGRAYFDETVDQQEILAPWWSELDAHFRTVPNEDVPLELRLDKRIGPIVGGWEFHIPVIHIPTFLVWMEREIRSLGGVFLNQKVGSVSDLNQDFDLVINCSGGWATHITHDSSLIGYQGTVIELFGEPLGTDLIFVEKGKSASSPTYIVPQGVRTILGGTLKPVTEAGSRWTPGGDGLLAQWTGTEDDVNGIWERCAVLSPLLRSRPLPSISQLTIKTGVRPIRLAMPPRIEKESRTDIVLVHNYGHGGSGVTLFWGSAIAAYDLATQ